jgi:hypothetical protein
VSSGSTRPYPGCRRLVLVLLAAAGLLAGCGDDGSAVLDLSDGVTAYVSPESPDGAAATALVSGTLAVSDGGCLVLDGGAGERWFLGLPAGTEAGSSPSVTVSVGGETLAVGDVVSGGGGFHSDGWREFARVQWPDVPDACLSTTAGLAEVSGLARS